MPVLEQERKEEQRKAGTTVDTEMSKTSLLGQERTQSLSKQEEAKKKTETDFWQKLETFLGQELAKLVEKNITKEKLMEIAKKGAEALIDAGAKELQKVEIEGASEEDMAALQALEGAFGEWLKEQASALVESEEGQKLASEIAKWSQKFAKEHPLAVIALALACAVGAYLANAEVPALETRFALGKGVDARIKAKLGKAQDLSLKAVEVHLGYTASNVKAQLSGELAQGTGSVSSSVEVKDNDKSLVAFGSAQINKDGLLEAKARLSSEFKGVKVEGGAKFDKSRGTTGAVVLRYSGQEFDAGSDLSYDLESGLFRVKLSQDLIKQLNVDVLAKGYPTKAEDVEGVSIGITKDDFRARLDARFGEKREVQAQASATIAPNLTVEASGTYAVDENRITQFYARLGFKSPDEFKAFLLEYKRTRAKNIPTDQFYAEVDFAIKEILVRLENTTTVQAGKMTEGEAKALGAYKVNKDFAIIGGVGYGYGEQGRYKGVAPQLGVQIKDVAVTIGFPLQRDAQTPKFIIGITKSF